MKEDVLKLFGVRVRHLRKKKNWSQEELADRTGFHRTYIGMVERGERNVSLKNIAKFAEAFGLSIKELFEF